MYRPSTSDSRHRPLYTDNAIMSSAPALESDSGPVGKGKKRLACTSCRQAKIKCVGLRPGSKCERCQRKSMLCQVNSQYRRTAHSSKLQELSDEVQHLKGLLNTKATVEKQQGLEIGSGGPSSSQQSPPGADNLDHETADSLMFSARSGAVKDLENAQLEFTQATSAQALDRVTVEAPQISQLFQIFYRYFHPQMPLINDRIPIDTLFDLSPLLFWAVIAIASRSCEVESDLHTRLREPLTGLLWAKISTVPLSHFTIQAVLLLCTWPYTPVSLMSDPTSMLVSVAKSGCVQLGLHRPEHMQDYHRVRFDVQSEHIKEAVVIWVCCFIASESVTSGVGHDSIFTPDDPVLARAAEPDNSYDLPTSLHQTLRCYILLHQLRSMLSQAGQGIPDSRNTLLSAVLKSTELRLETLKTETGDDCQGFMQIELHCARLQVCLVYLQEHPNASTRQYGLAKAFHAASELIALLYAQSTQPGFDFATPRYFGQNLKLAALLLLKMRFSTASRLFDANEIEQLYKQAIATHKRMIIHDNDFDARAASFLGDLWRIRLKDSELQFQDPILSLTTRGGASLLYESQWQWRDYYAAAANSHEYPDRPPGVLPSIILHSPESHQNADDGQKTRGGSTHSPASIGQKAQTHAESNTGLAAMSGHVDSAGTYDLGDSLTQYGHDPLPDGLDLMYAYFDPDEEASQLYYTSWTSNMDESI